MFSWMRKDFDVAANNALEIMVMFFWMRKHNWNNGRIISESMLLMWWVTV